MNRRADKLDFFLSNWALPVEYLSVAESLNNQLFTVRKEAEQIKADRQCFYDNLEDKPIVASKEVYLTDIKEECEDVIKRCQGWISDNKKNIERMKKQDEATHRLFESLKEFDVGKIKIRDDKNADWNLPSFPKGSGGPYDYDYKGEE